MVGPFPSLVVVVVGRGDDDVNMLVVPADGAADEAWVVVRAAVVGTLVLMVEFSPMILAKPLLLIVLFAGVNGFVVGTAPVDGLLVLGVLVLLGLSVVVILVGAFLLVLEFQF